MRLNKDLLVFIFYKALSFGRETCHDGLICFLHRFFDILRSFSLGQDGVMDGESQFTASDEAETFRTWKDVERAVDRYGTTGSCSSSASWNAPFLNTPMCPVNERAPSGNTTNEVPSFRISRALA